MRFKIVSWAIFLIFLSVAGSSQEVIDLRGEVDTIRVKLIINDLTRFNGKRIIVESEGKKKFRSKQERTRKVLYHIHDEGEKDVILVNRRWYKRERFYIIEGKRFCDTSAKIKFYAYYDIIVMKNEKKKLPKLKKNDTVDVCLFCEKEPDCLVIIGDSWKNMLILLKGEYELPIYGSIYTRFCYIKGGGYIRKTKKSK